ncbi:hypothetical protein COLSTE_02201 [Collinsella stercoris DSM 13279]|uniref:Uncharacterized protein n=1 Tax=Collinsella stercoris DSM 13279 TaxID=445975 RepID=B6GDL8_9ACTN|nr:hypothetical protein COLSTE_02201 [Collinsella stercoris DSM 13279]
MPDVPPFYQTAEWLDAARLPSTSPCRSMVGRVRTYVSLLFHGNPRRLSVAR